MTNSNSLVGLVGTTNYDLSEFESTTAYQFSQFLENQENGLYDTPADLDLYTEPTVPDNSFTNAVPNGSVTTIDTGETTFDLYSLDILNDSDTIDFVDSIEGSNHPDIYQFSIDQSNEIAITLDGLSADADLWLYDSNYELVAVSNNPSFEAETLSGTLNAGNYTLGVVSYDGDDTDYSLSIQTGELASATGIDPASESVPGSTPSGGWDDLYLF